MFPSGLFRPQDRFGESLGLGLGVLFGKNFEFGRKGKEMDGFDTDCGNYVLVKRNGWEDGEMGGK